MKLGVMYTVCVTQYCGNLFKLIVHYICYDLVYYFILFCVIVVVCSG